VGTPVDNVEGDKIGLASNVVSVGESAVLLFEEGYDECNIRWWSVAGVLMGEESNVEQGVIKTTPQVQGVYLLEVRVGDVVEVKKIIVK